MGVYLFRFVGRRILQIFIQIMTKKNLFKVNRSESFWKSKEAQRNFFDRLAKQWNFKTLEDWYQISLSQLQKAGGSGILLFYRGSQTRALMSVYPGN